MDMAGGPDTGAEGGPGGTRAYRMQARRDAVERTRTGILQAAYDLWLARPYDEVTIDAIADAAGVTRQTVHRQFGSKEDLVVAVTEWRGHREEVLRAVEPGDVDGAVKRVVARNEEMGDATIRFLQLEGRVAIMDHVLKHGREAHRAWLEQVFAPYLPQQRGRRRDQAVLALYAATDVTVWKLLRRDFGRTPAQTEAVISQLVQGVLRTLAHRSEEEGT